MQLAYNTALKLKGITFPVERLASLMTFYLTALTVKYLCFFHVIVTDAPDKAQHLPYRS